MILGIDAHCIRGDGGSITHLREVLRAAEPDELGFERVILWSGARTLERIEDRPWLEKRREPVLERGLLARSFWSSTRLSTAARQAGCDVLWLPGCSFAGSFRPYVAMSRNMLPFDWNELKRYFPWPRFAKFVLLRFSQARTFRGSDGLIYLTGYAQRKIGDVVGSTRGESRVIAHGIAAEFSGAGDSGTTRTVKPAADVFRLLYVSVVDMYKHQWHVVEAVSLLQEQGFRVELSLVGPRWPPAARKLRAALRRFPAAARSVSYVGPVSHRDLQRHYGGADVFVYASSCENLPNILLEAMASGVAIASSNRSPMPEVLRDGGLFFDPEKPSEIAAAIAEYLRSPALRERKAELARLYASEYSWSKCARETFAYLSEVAARNRLTPPVGQSDAPVSVSR